MKVVRSFRLEFELVFPPSDVVLRKRFEEEVLGDNIHQDAKN